jgi:hypothetical protein
MESNFEHKLDHFAKCHMSINTDHLAIGKNQVVEAKNPKKFMLVKPKMK